MGIWEYGSTSPDVAKRRRVGALFNTYFKFFLLVIIILESIAMISFKPFNISY
jgi:hypothetical protein